ncbi:ParB-like nuclease [Escherichia coli]|nr:ParB-like nuclease [Escherichia coli]SQN24219.1 ParB-like nuclease [Escherichia coli]SQO15260.1 ParB-like nuclease [Escherichia coli]SVF41403.1 ParB-like nuclease [Escherichia coli]SVF50659.1 ParB-like nuclease [Escherichia coli]
MGDSVTPEIIGNMIRQYFSQERPEEETIQALNHLRRVLHEVSPFAHEPVDCVLWVKADEVVANDYNPNVMAPGEKKLLKQSLEKDGFTQPVVVSEEKNHVPGGGWFSSPGAGQGSRYGKTSEGLAAGGLY